MQPAAEASQTRRTIYALFITLTAAVVAGHIISVTRLYDPSAYRDEKDSRDTRGTWSPTRPEPTPTHGENDRSRWDTVRALVDNGTYAVGRRVIDDLATGKFHDEGIITEKGWTTIDKVLRPETSQFYSSKPPLLPTLVAGEYWVLKKCFGWSIVPERWYVVRTILLTFNWLPFVVYLVLLSRLVERFGTTDWGRLYVLAAAGFGTFVTTFLTTFNNHTLAACTALFALYPALRIWYDGERRADLFLLAGLFAGLTATNELPAAALVLALGVLLVVRAPGKTLLFFVPAAALPVAAFFLTNYLAVGQLRPAYSEFGSPWYEYANSYWKIAPGEVKHGIDWAYLTESRAEYAWNVLLGHHGLLSLSPIYFLAVAGMLSALIGQPGKSRLQQAPTQEKPAANEPGPRMVALLTLLLTLVVLGFYVVGVNERNRNYGGVANGLRWLIWLTPLWLLSLLPVADWLASKRWGRILALVLLAISIFSAGYRAWNPWLHPWLYEFYEARGWIHY